MAELIGDNPERYQLKGANATDADPNTDAASDANQPEARQSAAEGAAVAAGVITRCCHMQTQPLVHVGQPVIVGQPLGLVGSRGHSSGPHLHYETHMGGDRTPAGAVEGHIRRVTRATLALPNA